MSDGKDEVKKEVQIKIENLGVTFKDNSGNDVDRKSVV